MGIGERDTSSSRLLPASTRSSGCASSISWIVLPQQSAAATCRTSSPITSPPAGKQMRFTPHDTTFLDALVKSRSLAMVVVTASFRLIHHLQHCRSAGPHEAPDEQASQYEKNDVQNA